MNKKFIYKVRQLRHLRRPLEQHGGCQPLPEPQPDCRLTRVFRIPIKIITHLILTHYTQPPHMQCESIVGEQPDGHGAAGDFIQQAELHLRCVHQPWMLGRYLEYADGYGKPPEGQGSSGGDICGRRHAKHARPLLRLIQE